MTDPGQRLGGTQVYQLRLSASAEEKVHWLAQQHGVAPVTLLQGWVLQRLHHEFGGQDPYPR